MPRKTFAAVLAGVILTFAASAQDSPGNHSVDAVRASLHLADPALTIECVASEPDVIDPVAVTWDEDGAMYVVEMRDYPAGPAAGTVRRLTDKDRDGTYENATVFADNLPFPNSALAYNGGLLVTAAPDLLFLKDNDGDGVADERRVVLTGFAGGNPQLRINHLLWGLDNWIYAANGRSGGSVRRPGDPPENAVALRQHDLRFKPDASVIEPVAGFSQFGLCLDDWGNRFLSWSTDPIRHVVLEDRYLMRDRLLPFVSSEALIAESDRRIYPEAPKQRRFNSEAADTWNASCGLTIYRGDAMPKYTGNAFVCESLASLVHRMDIEPKGPTFIARRADKGREFLASTDYWFRAVNLATGPDGALYVVDFAREWVEYPDALPQEERESMQWRNGDTLGRIWRIRPKTWAPARNGIHTLSGVASNDLVPYLSNANAWYRTQAQRLLVTRNDASVVPLLKEAARASATPQGRIHALWTLDGLHALDDTTLVAALKDADAHVRREAVLLCEPHVADPKILVQLALLAHDPDTAVRFQLAATAGLLPTDPRLAICREIAATDAEDKWFRLALLGSINRDMLPFVQSLFELNKQNLDAYAFVNFDFLGALCEEIGASNRAGDIASLLTGIAQQRFVTAVPDIAMLSGLTHGLSQTGKPLRQWLLQPGDGISAETIATLGHAFESANYVAHKDGARDFLRAAAVMMLAQDPDPSGVDTVKVLLTTGDNDAVRAAALDALVNGGDRDVVASMLSDWRKLTRPAQRALVTSLVQSEGTSALLLDAIESGTPSPIEIEPAAREALLGYPVPELKGRAEKAFASSITPEKEELIQKYSAALDLAGDKARGADIFAKNCLPCHQVLGIGQHVGPDLSKIGSKPKRQLIHSILNPGEEIAPDYISYTISTSDFEVVNGVLGAETASSITLRQAAGIETTVQRNTIEDMTVSNQSLMPQGLEAAFDVQGMADLLEFLTHPDHDLLNAAAQKAIPAPAE